MSWQIPHECALPQASIVVCGADVFLDLRWRSTEFELFHGVTQPFYSAENIPWHFAANEPAKPPG